MQEDPGRSGADWYVYGADAPAEATDPCGLCLQAEYETLDCGGIYTECPATVYYFSYPERDAIAAWAQKSVQEAQDWTKWWPILGGLSGGALTQVFRDVAGGWIGMLLGVLAGTAVNMALNNIISVDQYTASVFGTDPTSPAYVETDDGSFNLFMSKTYSGFYGPTHQEVANLPGLVSDLFGYSCTVLDLSTFYQEAGWLAMNHPDWGFYDDNQHRSDS